MKKTVKKPAPKSPIFLGEVLSQKVRELEARLNSLDDIDELREVFGIHHGVNVFKSLQSLDERVKKLENSPGPSSRELKLALDMMPNVNDLEKLLRTRLGFPEGVNVWDEIRNVKRAAAQSQDLENPQDDWHSRALKAETELENLKTSLKKSLGVSL